MYYAQKIRLLEITLIYVNPFTIYTFLLYSLELSDSFLRTCVA